jgi:uncharacterized protein
VKVTITMHSHTRTHTPGLQGLRRAAAAALALGALGLLACGTPQPAAKLYQLRTEPPVPVKAASSRHTVQLMAPVRVPELLDRSELWLPQGQAGLQPLTGHRWAEPLRDAIPRVMQQDLVALLGDQRVWVAPVPAAVAITRQLRVEVQSLLPRADRAAVLLQARYTVADTAAGGTAQASSLSIEVPTSSAEPDALVAGYRLALWRLAERIAAGL